MSDRCVAWQIKIWYRRPIKWYVEISWTISTNESCFLYTIEFGLQILWCIERCFQEAFFNNLYLPSVFYSIIGILRYAIKGTQMFPQHVLTFRIYYICDRHKMMLQMLKWFLTYWHIFAIFKPFIHSNPALICYSFTYLVTVGNKKPKRTTKYSNSIYSGRKS